MKICGKTVKKIILKGLEKSLIRLFKTSVIAIVGIVPVAIAYCVKSTEGLVAISIFRVIFSDDLPSLNSISVRGINRASRVSVPVISPAVVDSVRREEVDEEEHDQGL